jgi:hypothetical protein
MRSCDSLSSSSYGVACRHAQRIDDDADVAARRHLRRRRGQAGGAHVLDRDDVAAVNELETCLEEQLLGERVPDLHAWSLGLARRRQVFARE